MGQINPKTDKREGRGACAFDNGLIYEGIWKAGQIDGLGRLIDLRNERQIVYEGVWS